MDLLQLLILQFIAHLLSDYIFQPSGKAKDKNENGFRSKYLYHHILLTFVFSWILSFQINFIFGALAIAITHLFVDGIKKYISANKKIGNYSFFIDQSIHLIIILVVVVLFTKNFETKPLLAITVCPKWLLIIAAYLISTKPANILIKEIFRTFKIQPINKDNDDLPNAGKLIGVIERFLVLTFIILNQYEAVGFLIAAKSILRFKDGNTIKTEYVLIGTMLSFGIAIFCGIIIDIT